MRHVGVLFHRLRRELGLLVSAVAALATILPSTATAAGWIEPSPGPLNVETTKTAWGASVTDVGGVAYVAWSEGTPVVGARNNLFVARYSGGVWDGVGGLIDQTVAADPQITTARGVPYLAYAESSGQVFVDRLNSGVWETIGGAPLAAPINDSRYQAQWVSIAGDREGNPYVAWSEHSDDFSRSHVYVSGFVHGAWQSTTPGRSLNIDPNNYAVAPRIANVNGTLWITWVENFANGGLTIVVEHFNGSRWVQDATPEIGTDATYASDPDIADVGGVPYIAWTDVRNGTRGLHVSRFDPHAIPNWVPVGGPLDNSATTTGIGMPRIAGVDGVPWVTWAGSGLPVPVRVKEFLGGAWQSVGGPLNVDPTKNALAPAIASVGGVPYVAFDQETTNNANGALLGEPWQLHVKVAQREMPLRFTSLSSSHRPAGTTLAIGLNRRADVRLDFTRPALGRRVGGLCAAQTAKNQSKPVCTRAVTVATLRFRGHAGINRVDLDGRLSDSQKLRPGRYHVWVTLIDAAGRSSQRRSANITI